jgi:hypothetical protein
MFTAAFSKLYRSILSIFGGRFASRTNSVDEKGRRSDRVENRKNIRCSFCQRHYSIAAPLVEGPGNVFICCDCAQACLNEINKSGRRNHKRAEDIADSTERTRFQIREMVGEIERLSKAAIAPQEFFREFLQRIIASLAAIGGAVWIAQPDGRLQLEYHFGFDRAELNRDDLAKGPHARLIDSVFDEGNAQVIQPRWEIADTNNPTDYLLVCGLLERDGNRNGIVEIIQRAGGRPAVERGYLRFVNQMCELANEFQSRRSDD